MLVYLQMIDSPENQSKFEDIYRKYRDVAFSVAYRILGNADDAEDAVHYAFIKVIENFSKIDEIDCLKTKGYIVIIVKNRAIDIYRSRQNHPSVAYNEETVGSTVEYDGDNALAGCILKLPPRQRDVIILKYHHGYELKEVAKMLGITYTNALSIDQRAKKKLKALCEEAELV